MYVDDVDSHTNIRHIASRQMIAMWHKIQNCHNRGKVHNMQFGLLDLGGYNIQWSQNDLIYQIILAIE